jgi:hypothetical protein
LKEQEWRSHLHRDRHGEIVLVDAKRARAMSSVIDRGGIGNVLRVLQEAEIKSLQHSATRLQGAIAAVDLS